MKKQITTAAAVALITLASSSFALAGALDFDPIADADLLAGGASFGSTEVATVVTFDSLADADILAGESSWAVNSIVSSASAACDHLADAENLDSHTCPNAVVSAQ